METARMEQEIGKTSGMDEVKEGQVAGQDRESGGVLDAAVLENETPETPDAGVDQDKVESCIDTKENGGGSHVHYAVNVKKYADYSGVHEFYSDDEKSNLRYAGKTPFARFCSDLFYVLTRPSAFWRSQERHPATTGQLIFPHLTVLICLRGLALFASSLMRAEAVVYQSLVQVLAQEFLIFVLVFVLALLISALTALTGGGFSYERSVRFVGYGITPLIFVGIVSIIPLPYFSTFCDLLAMPWAFVVMGAGILPCLRIDVQRAPTMSALFCGLLLCLWGGMPILIPYLIGLY